MHPALSETVARERLRDAHRAAEAARLAAAARDAPPRRLRRLPQPLAWRPVAFARRRPAPRRAH